MENVNEEMSESKRLELETRKKQLLKEVNKSLIFLYNLLI